ncbi:hypothetical protein SAMN06265222_117137 [Neorhodopirellula lusitana]|uniref:Uncharacterized protein n=1 Tax=Neorhodopirellula lusitana TaxID=445327 RepID=A0ABY1QLL8_9BACT|nr:hypothetical protein SAMN06265222_117137 [Neorhodopirellula lusitana]
MGWLVRGNARPFRDASPDMESFNSPLGLVVMKRRSNIESKKEIRDLWAHDKSEAHPQVLDDDELISRV